MLEDIELLLLLRLLELELVLLLLGLLELEEELLLCRDEDFELQEELADSSLEDALEQLEHDWNSR